MLIEHSRGEETTDAPRTLQEASHLVNTRRIRSKEEERNLFITQPCDPYRQLGIRDDHMLVTAIKEQG